MGLQLNISSLTGRSSKVTQFIGSFGHATIATLLSQEKHHGNVSIYGDLLQ